MASPTHSGRRTYRRPALILGGLAVLVGVVASIALTLSPGLSATLGTRVPVLGQLVPGLRQTALPPSTPVSTAPPPIGTVVPAGWLIDPTIPCGDSAANLRSYPNRGITLPTPALPAEEVHPRADFTAADVPLIRQRALGTAPDPRGLYKRNWSKILADVEARNAGGTSPDDRNARTAKANAFAFVITGEERYRSAAFPALTAAFTKPEDDDLDIAVQLTLYAQAYDYLGATLSPESPEYAPTRAAVKRGAQWAADYLQGKNPGNAGSNPRPHNHRSKIATALGLWSLVFSADPDAGRWLTLSMDQANSVYQFMFTQDGVYLDGHGYYWTYQYFHALPFYYALQHAGADPFPALQPVFEWMVRESTPKGWLTNAEDGWVKLTWTAVVAPAYRQTRTALHSTAPLAGVLQWRFFNQDYDAVQYPGGSWTGSNPQQYLWPDELIHVDQSILEAQPDAPGLQSFDRGGNSTVFRSDWRVGDPKTRWALFYGAPRSNNHDHCDAMQVLFDAEGTTLLNDFGYGPQRFDARAAYIPPHQHNVVTLNSKGAPDVYANVMDVAGGLSDYAEKLAYFDAPQEGTALARTGSSGPSATTATKSWRRGVLFAAHDYLVILDTLTAPSAEQWDLYLHSRGALTRTANRATWAVSPTSFGPAALHALVLPAAANVTQKATTNNLFGSRAGPPDTEVNTALQVGQKSATAQYLTVAVPRARQAEAPALTDVSRGDVLGATIVYDGNQDVALSQTGRGPANAGRLSARARNAWLRERAGVAAGWTLVDGDWLAAGPTELFRASHPVTATADLASASPSIRIVTESPVTLTIAGAYRSVTLDGKPVAATTRGAGTEVEIPVTGTLALGK